MGFGYGGFDMGFGAFEIIFIIVFVIVIGAFIVTAVKGGWSFLLSAQSMVC